MTRAPIQPSSIITRSAEVAFREVDGETVMMSVQAGKYYSLDAMGGRIWAMLDQPRSVNDICAAIVDNFEVERETCERDVLDFLEKLAADDLVRVSDAPLP